MDVKPLCLVSLTDYLFTQLSDSNSSGTGVLNLIILFVQMRSLRRYRIVLQTVCLLLRTRSTVIFLARSTTCTRKNNKIRMMKR